MGCFRSRKRRICAFHVDRDGKLLHIPVEACLASEFRYSEPLLGETALVIVSSQSGETLVVALATYEPLVEKSLFNIVEVKSRGAEVTAKTIESDESLICGQSSEIFVIPKIHTLLQPVWV